MKYIDSNNKGLSLQIFKPIHKPQTNHLEGYYKAKIITNTYFNDGYLIYVLSKYDQNFIDYFM
jgi:hypothetical protein